MSKHLISMFVAGGILLSFLSLEMFAKSEVQTSSQFILPQKHKTNLTRSEQKGKSLYEYYCALCHGKTGEADGFNAYVISTLPAKFADTNRMGALSDALIQQTIREGGSSRGLSALMPPWGGVLTDKDISDLTSFIRTFTRQNIAGK